MIQEFVAKLSDKEKKILYIALGVLSLALLDRVFLGPAMNKLDMQKIDIAKQKVIVQSDMQILKHRDHIVDKAKGFEKYYSKVTGDENEINRDFLRKLEVFASQASINLIKGNPSHINKYGQYSEHYANVDVSGQLKNMITFIHKVNSSNDLFKIERFTITPKRGTEGEVNASMSIVKLSVTPVDSE